MSCLFASQEEVNGQTVSSTVYSREQQEALHHRESARQAIDKLTTALAELSLLNIMSHRNIPQRSAPSEWKTQELSVNDDETYLVEEYSPESDVEKILSSVS